MNTVNFLHQFFLSRLHTYFFFFFKYAPRVAQHGLKCKLGLNSQLQDQDPQASLTESPRHPAFLHILIQGQPSFKEGLWFYLSYLKMN